MLPQLRPISNHPTPAAGSLPADTMALSDILSKIFDPYDRRARLAPGLLVLLPAVLFVATTFGSAHPVVTTLASVLMACSGPYALANIVRTYGQRAQERLYTRWGGKPTTILLRHVDARLAPATKTLYHQLIKSKLSLAMPTADDELANPQQADGMYVSAADALIRSTRDANKYPLVFKELVTYGFNRNCYGVKWLGVLVALVAATSALVHDHVVQLHAPFLDPAAIENLSLGGVMTLIVSVALLLVWLAHFTPTTVKQSGISYAERLCEALNALPRATTPPAKPRTAAGKS
jgi:hypothetical protein